MIDPNPIELARMGVAPFCGRCGNPAMFMRRPESIDDLIPVECGSYNCGWKGVSRYTVQQPQIINDGLELFSVKDPDAGA